MSFKISDTHVPSQQNQCCPMVVLGKRLVCYTPQGLTFDGQASLLLQPNLPKARVVTDSTLAKLPVTAIIDRVEYVAYWPNGTFSTKGEFNLGLGQLNGPIMSPLITDATSLIANTYNGGMFDIISDNDSGANSRPLVKVMENHVNFVSEDINVPVTGSLRVDIFYHLKD